MKDKKELETIKMEVKELTTKLKELDEDELNQVTGGEYIWDIAVKLKEKFKLQSFIDHDETIEKETYVK